MAPIMRGLLGTIVAAVLLATASAEPLRSRAEEPDKLAGQLLVAAPTMEDPSFARSVIYVIAHGSDGALGVIVNQPVKKVSLSDLLQLMRLPPQPLDGTLPVNFGGPVEPRMGFVLHSTDVMIEQHELTAGGLAITTDPQMFTAIAKGQGPKKFIVVLGYAGWGPGQLEMEMQRGDWVVVPNDPELVFAPDPAQTWKRALGRQGPTL